jgi:hypothetical protein
MHRFIDGSEEANELTKEVREQYFPNLEKAFIKVLFDTKMRKKGNKLVLGRMLKCNDLIRKLTDTQVEDGCDYIMFLDQVVFENISREDKIRLIRHELRHCKAYDTVKEGERPKYKLVPHDIEDFVIEIELNKDNVGWASNAVQLATDIYDQLAEDTREKENFKKTEKKV